MGSANSVLSSSAAAPLQRSKEPYANRNLLDWSSYHGPASHAQHAAIVGMLERQQAMQELMTGQMQRLLEAEKGRARAEEKGDQDKIAGLENGLLTVARQQGQMQLDITALTANVRAVATNMDTISVKLDTISVKLNAANRPVVASPGRADHNSLREVGSALKTDPPAHAPRQERSAEHVASGQRPAKGEKSESLESPKGQTHGPPRASNHASSASPILSCDVSPLPDKVPAERRKISRMASASLGVVVPVSPAQRSHTERQGKYSGNSDGYLWKDYDAGKRDADTGSRDSGHSPSSISGLKRERGSREG